MSDASITVSRRPDGVRIVDGTLADCERRHAATLHEAARAAGFAEALASTAQALDAASVAFEEKRAELLEVVAQDAARLAVEMLQELLRVELVAQNYDIVEIVRSTIVEAGNSPGAMALHMHPEDALKLEGVAFRSGTTVAADPAVRRGDAELHTVQGLLVRDMDACAASIRERILAEVRSC